MKIINRIKKILELSKKSRIDILEKLSMEELIGMPNEDEKAVFIGDGTINEFNEYKNEKNYGVKRLFALNDETYT
jgi:hypothetical protein